MNTVEREIVMNQLEQKCFSSWGKTAVSSLIMGIAFAVIVVGIFLAVSTMLK